MFALENTLINYNNRLTLAIVLQVVLTLYETIENETMSLRQLTFNMYVLRKFCTFLWQFKKSTSRYFNTICYKTRAHFALNVFSLRFSSLTVLIQWYHNIIFKR